MQFILQLLFKFEPNRFINGWVMANNQNIFYLLRPVHGDDVWTGGILQVFAPHGLSLIFKSEFTILIIQQYFSSGPHIWIKIWPSNYQIVW